MQTRISSDNVDLHNKMHCVDPTMLANKTCPSSHTVADNEEQIERNGSTLADLLALRCSSCLSKIFFKHFFEIKRPL